MNYEILPVIADFNYVDFIAPSKYELVFMAENLPPLGLKYFYIQLDTDTLKRAITVNKKQTRFGNTVSIYIIVFYQTDLNLVFRVLVELRIYY